MTGPAWAFLILAIVIIGAIGIAIDRVSGADESDAERESWNDVLPHDVPGE
jgi:hypothetical protein